MRCFTLVVLFGLGCTHREVGPATPKVDCTSDCPAADKPIAVGTRLPWYASWNSACSDTKWVSKHDGSEEERETTTFSCNDQKFTYEVHCDACEHGDDPILHNWVAPTHAGPFQFSIELISGAKHHMWQSPRYQVSDSLPPARYGVDSIDLELWCLPATGGAMAPCDSTPVSLAKPYVAVAAKIGPSLRFMDDFNVLNAQRTVERFPMPGDERHTAFLLNRVYAPPGGFAPGTYVVEVQVGKARLTANVAVAPNALSDQ